MDSTEIQEGFLCPVCITRFDGIDPLRAHINEHHGEVDKNFIFPLKGLFDKARQKLLKLESLIDPTEVFSELTVVDLKYEEPEQELGPTTSHTSYFNKERNSRVDDVAVETNKLIIRLDKLITDAPSEPSKRKGIFETFEQEVIPWLSDSEAQQCNLCGVKFSITKRKHHCRLCGKILCSSCSKFLTFTYARKLVNPAYAVMYQVEVDSLKKQQTEANAASGQSHLKANSSISSSSNLNLRNAERFLMSGLSKLKHRDGSEEGEEHIRVCRNCNDLLEKRDRQVEQRTKTPMVIQVYDRLFTFIAEAERLFQSYFTMSRSLSEGESKYELQMARDLRVKIVKLQEQIDYVCKKLGSIGTTTEEILDESQVERKQAPSVSAASRESVLIQTIQRFTYEFLRDMAFGMPNLPDNEEYAKLQQKQKMALEAKIQNERAAASASASSTFLRPVTVTEIKVASSALSMSHHNRLYRPPDTGWAPNKKALTSSLSSFAINPFDEQKSIDPLEEQIIYIKELIRQAAIDGRTEIVETLTKNLYELNEELVNRKTTCDAPT